MSLENITNSYYGGKKWIQILKIKLMLAWDMLCDLCANLIEFIKNIISSEEFISRHRKSEKNFTRNRCLPFASMIIFMMNLIKCAIQVELDHFFQLINGSDLPERGASKAAFSMARKKIKYEAFAELCRKVASFFYDHFPQNEVKGFEELKVAGGQRSFALFEWTDYGINGYFVYDIEQMGNSGQRTGIALRRV
ncbi:MAG: hypothetical protein HQK56_03545 [Deltaproteobacteria bacterium]|nr:hypothetical protein [Deltaproteobacteria bacterium]